MSPGKDVLGLPTRRAIFEVVRDAPGTHLRGIEREVHLPFGQVLYHLDYLERHGLVVARRDGGFKRYFVAHAVGRLEKDHIAVFRHALPRRLAVLLLLEPGATHGRLASQVPVSGSTLSFHLGKMTEAGVVARETRGSEHRYALLDEKTAARTLIYHRESWQDSLVDRFADVWLAASFRPFAERRAAIEAEPTLAAKVRGILEEALPAG